MIAALSDLLALPPRSASSSSRRSRVYPLVSARARARVCVFEQHREEGKFARRFSRAVGEEEERERRWRRGLAALAERTERAMKYDSAVLQRQPPPRTVSEGVGSHLMRIQWSTVVAGASCASLFSPRAASCVPSPSRRRRKIRDADEPLAASSRLGDGLNG